MSEELFDDIVREIAAFTSGLEDPDPRRGSDDMEKLEAACHRLRHTPCSRTESILIHVSRRLYLLSGRIQRASHTVAAPDNADPIERALLAVLKRGWTSSAELRVVLARFVEASGVKSAADSMIVDSARVDLPEAVLGSLSRGRDDSLCGQVNGAMRLEPLRRVALDMMAAYVAACQMDDRFEWLFVGQESDEDLGGESGAGGGEANDDGKTEEDDECGRLVGGDDIDEAEPWFTMSEDDHREQLIEIRTSMDMLRSQLVRTGFDAERIARGLAAHVSPAIIDCVHYPNFTRGIRGAAENLLVAVGHMSDLEPRAAREDQAWPSRTIERFLQVLAREATPYSEVMSGLERELALVASDAPSDSESRTSVDQGVEAARIEEIGRGVFDVAAFGERKVIQGVGAAHLVELLSRAGESIDVLALAGQEDTLREAAAQVSKVATLVGHEQLARLLTGSPQALVDQATVSSIRARLEDPGAPEEERESLACVLREIKNVHGRVRRWKTESDRAVRSVQRAVTRAVGRLREDAPRIAEHLDQELEIKKEGATYGRKSPLRWMIRRR